MTANPYAGQLEQQVLNADPIELVGIMLDHLVASVLDARRSLQSGDRLSRGRSIAKALGLLGELSCSLDFRQGGELARTLQQLYGFVADRLVQAQTRQLEKPLIEAAETLLPLRDAWRELDRARSSGIELAISGENSQIDAESNLRFSMSA